MTGFELVRLQPEQVLKAGDEMTGNLSMLGAAKFIGPLQGNADTATQLRNTVQINGTNFNGTSGITTTQWGAPREIRIGNKALSVNGSTNYQWSLQDIGALGAGANAVSATKLQTARRINDTLFNGEGDITTAKWGEARSIKIGNKSISVNGSQATYEWKLTDIGAAPAVHTHDYIPITASCNKNWNWNGQSGQPTWLWGGNDSTNMYVYNPSNFRVSHANTADSATTANTATTANNSLKIGGKNIFVQQGQPTAQATGDIWISW